MSLYKKGDVVRIVAKVSWGSWCTEMDQYVNDGKTYVVKKDTDYRGDTLVDVNGTHGFQDGCLYFPPESLQLLENADRLINNITVAAYECDGVKYETRNSLLWGIADKMIGEFNQVVNIKEDDVERLIKQLLQLKEVCQKLK